MTVGWLPPVSPPSLRAPKVTGDGGAKTSPSNGSSFEDVLNRTVSGPRTLQVSAHAKNRLQERGVQWSDSDWNKVQSAVDAAGGKGARDAYLVYGQVGLVVNVPNRTVVTALEHRPQTVVTNIDSVVVV